VSARDDAPPSESDPPEAAAAPDRTGAGRASIEAAADGAPLVTRLEWHAEIASTQARALDLAAEGADPGTLVVARAQTAGVGRHGHRWASPPGGLWLSLVVDMPAPPPARAPDGALAPSIVAALAAREAVLRAAGVDARLKWPNDLLVGARKLAGAIVTERGGRAVVGVGIDVNIRRADLPPDVAAVATSTLEETGRATPLGAVLRAFLEALAPRLASRAAGLGELREEAAALLVREHPVRWTRAPGERPRLGRILDMLPSGALLLDTAEGRAIAAAGDLEVLRP
jgi:BirA family biotin operon repressor/biotin-[acetyl-CoA-carboxylase] ligase